MILFYVDVVLIPSFVDLVNHCKAQGTSFITFYIVLSSTSIFLTSTSIFVARLLAGLKLESSRYLIILATKATVQKGQFDLFTAIQKS